MTRGPCAKYSLSFLPFPVDSFATLSLLYLSFSQVNNAPDSVVLIFAHSLTSAPERK